MKNEPEETESAEVQPAPAGRAIQDWDRTDVIVTEEDGEYPPLPRTAPS